MIRKASLKDIDKINILGKILEPNYDSIYNLSNQINNKISIIIVEEEQGEIRGFLYAQKLIDHIDLLNIVVAKDYQRQKIGTNLIKYLINNYEGSIFLEVATDNIPALELYKSLDFRVINVRPNYYNEKDAFLMKRG